MRHRWTNRWTAGTVAGLTAATLAVLAAGAVPATASPATAGTAGTARAAAACPAVTWGSLARNGAPAAGARPPAAQPTVRGVRAGRHACFDRLVIDLAGREPGFTVRYVDRVTEDGSGRVVPVRGGARLQVTVYAPAYDADGDPTYSPANRRELAGVTGFGTFRQVAWAGTFEGYTNLGLGVRARLPFRVLQLEGPGTGSRVVLDVAHTW
jgi:hypothetical protein